MKKTYCDRCGNAFDSWHQTSKYNIRIDDDPMGFRWLDICDDCAEEFIKLLDNFLGSDEGGGGI